MADVTITADVQAYLKSMNAAELATTRTKVAISSLGVSYDELTKKEKNAVDAGIVAKAKMDASYNSHKKLEKAVKQLTVAQQRRNDFVARSITSMKASTKAHSLLGDAITAMAKKLDVSSNAIKETTRYSDSLRASLQKTTQKARTLASTKLVNEANIRALKNQSALVQKLSTDMALSTITSQAYRQGTAQPAMARPNFGNLRPHALPTRTVIGSKALGEMASDPIAHRMELLRSPKPMKTWSETQKSAAKYAILSKELARSTKQINIQRDALRQLITVQKSQRELANKMLPALTEQRRNYRKNTKSIKAGTEATNQLALSWKSVVKLFAVQLAHRALATFVRSVDEGIQKLIEFQTKIAEIQTISQGSGISTNEWAASLRGLSDSFGLDVLTQTEGAYQALSNQVVNSADTFDFLREANKLAITTVGSVDDAVNLLTGTINAYGLRAEDTDKISASFFKTVELGRVRLDEMANSMGRIAVPSSKLGISLNELQAMLTTFTRQGVSFKEASTYIRNILLKLIKPSKEMSQMFYKMGVDSGEAAIAAYGFDGVLQQVEETTKGSTTELGKLYGRLRAITGGLLAGGDNLEAYKKDLNGMNNAVVSAGNAFDIVMANLGKRLEVETNKVKNFFTQTLGQASLAKLAELTNNFNNLSKYIIELSTVLAGVFAGGLAAAVIGIGALAAMNPVIAGVTATVGLLGYAYTKMSLASTIAYNNAIIDADKWAEDNTDAFNKVGDGLNDLHNNFKEFTKEQKRIGAERLAASRKVTSEILEDIGETSLALKASLSIYKDIKAKELSELESITSKLQKLKGNITSFLDTEDLRIQDLSFKFQLDSSDLKGKLALIDKEIAKRDDQIKKAALDPANFDKVKDLMSSIINLEEQRINLLSKGGKTQIAILQKRKKLVDQLGKAQAVFDAKEIEAKKEIKRLKDILSKPVSFEGGGKANDRALKAFNKLVKLKERLARKEKQDALDFQNGGTVAERRNAEIRNRRLKKEIRDANRIFEKVRGADQKGIAQAGAAREVARVQLQAAKDALAIEKKKIKIAKDAIAKDAIAKDARDKVEVIPKVRGKDLDAKRQETLEKFKVILEGMDAKAHEARMTNEMKLFNLKKQHLKDLEGIKLLQSDLNIDRTNPVEALKEIKKQQDLLRDFKPKNGKEAVKSRLLELNRLAEQLTNEADIVASNKAINTMTKNATEYTLATQMVIDDTGTTLKEVSRQIEEMSNLLQSSVDAIEKPGLFEKILVGNVPDDLQATGDPQINRGSLYGDLLTSSLISPILFPGEDKQREKIMGSETIAKYKDLIAKAQEFTRLQVELANAEYSTPGSLENLKTLGSELQVYIEEFKSMFSGKEEEPALQNFLKTLNDTGTQLKESLPAALEVLKGALENVEGIQTFNTLKDTVSQANATIEEMAQAILGLPDNKVIDIIINKTTVKEIIKKGQSESSFPYTWEDTLFRGFDEFARGGLVRHFSNGTDTVPAMLSPGEMVMNTGASQKYYSQLSAMNRGTSTSNSTTLNGGLNVSISTSGNESIDAQVIARELNRELQRGTITLRGNR